MMSLLQGHLKSEALEGVALIREFWMSMSLALEKMKICLRWELVKIRRSSWKE